MSTYVRPEPLVTDLPWRIPTPAGEVLVSLDTEADRYRITGPSGQHSLATEPWNTDRARLIAHVIVFVESNGGTFTPPPDPAAASLPPRSVRESIGAVAVRVREAIRSAKAEARPVTEARGGRLVVRLAEVLLVDHDLERVRPEAIDVIQPAALSGRHLTAWRKAARAAGAPCVLLQGAIGWTRSPGEEEEPTDITWAVRVPIVQPAGRSAT